MKIELRISAIPPYLWRMHTGNTPDGKWRKIRREILKRDNYTCRACGIRSEKYMEVHHINGDHTDNRPENLVTLCPMCHAVFHAGITGIQRRGTLITSRIPQIDIIKLARSHALFEKGSAHLLRKMKITGMVEKIGREKDLVILADRIHLGWKPPEEFRLFPFPEKFRAFPHWRRNMGNFREEHLQMREKYPSLFE